MTSLRLQEVLSIGMQTAAEKRARSGASSATITDENDPLFLLAAKAALDNALTNLVDPPDPSAAWEEQSCRRANRFDAGFFMYSDDDPDSVPRPDPEFVAEYDAIVKSNAERRTRLTTRLAVVEENLAASMSTELWDDYKRMLE
jgi:hypothetical protein